MSKSRRLQKRKRMFEDKTYKYKLFFLSVHYFLQKKKMILTAFTEGSSWWGTGALPSEALLLRTRAGLGRLALNGAGVGAAGEGCAHPREGLGSALLSSWGHALASGGWHWTEPVWGRLVRGVPTHVRVWGQLCRQGAREGCSSKSDSLCHLKLRH